MKINDILTNIVGPGGIASSNRYHVSFLPGETLQNAIGVSGLQSPTVYEKEFNSNELINNGIKLSFLCDEVNIPGFSVSTGDLKGYVPGINARYAHTKTFREFSMTFLMDRDHLPLKFLQSWGEHIFPYKQIDGTDENPNSANFSAKHNYYMLTNYYDDYTCDIFIEKIESDNKDMNSNSYYTTKGVSKYRIYKAFPYIVNDLTLSNGPNQPLKVQASFYFEHVREIAPSTPGVPLSEIFNGGPTV
jgi:hypothetical protein